MVVILSDQSVAVVQIARDWIGIASALEQPPQRIPDQNYAIGPADQTILYIIDIAAVSIRRQVAIGVVSKVGGTGSRVLI
ncbi:hypothetical protein D3C81_1885130 [compost metagenome]